MGSNGTEPHSTKEEASVRERLLAAAADVFAEKGWEGTRVQEVARQAGLTTGAIYGNFDGKAGLLLAAIEEEEGPGVMSRLLQIGDGSVGLEAMIELGSQLADRQHTRCDRHRFLPLEAFVAARRDPHFHELMRREMAKHVDALVHVIERGRAEGRVNPDVSTDALVRLSIALSFGFALFEALGIEHPPPGKWAELIKVLVDGLRPSSGTGEREMSSEPAAG